MTNNELKEKLDKLREIYKSDVDRKTLDDVEKALREKIQRKQILEIDVIQEIIEDAKSRVQQINWLLAYDETLDDGMRKALFRERSVWQFNLDRFGMSNVDDEINAIKSFVEDKLQK